MSVPASADGQPLWLTCRAEPIYAVLHSPPDGQRRDLAVLLLPPFGWDQVRSYRPRRQWAIALANAGFTVARIDLPGTEESVGSPVAPGRASSWKEAVATAAAWLKKTSGADRVAVIGIGLGGLLALEAVAEDAPIDDLILWAVPARGRASLRELQQYAALVTASFNEVERSGPARDGILELAGYPISEETAAWLGSLDVTKLPLPRADRRRVLLIERDARGVDGRLRAHLEQAGVELSVLAASDYASLITHAQAGAVPRQSIAGSIAWLQQASVVSGAAQPVVPAAATASSVTVPAAATSSSVTVPAAATSSSVTVPAAATSSSVTFEHDGRALRETMFEMEFPAGRLVGILCEPADGDGDGAEPCLVLVNPGANRRTGPNRMWTDAARRNAARGFSSVRFDLEGLGDSGGDGALYAGGQWFYESPRLNDLYRGVIARLRETGFAREFIAVGLCSGAYQGLHAALTDPSVCGGVLINLFTFQWSQPLLDERERRENIRRARQHLPASVRRPPRLNRARVRWVWKAAKVTARSGVHGSAEAAQARTARRMLDTLRGYGTEVVLLFSESEPVYHELERQGVLDELARWPNVALELLPTSDHIIRALPIQALVHEKIDRAIDSISTRRSGPGAGAPTPSRAGERGVVRLSG